MPHRPRILFVEDDLDSCEVTHRFLTSHGFEVICVQKASEVIQTAMEQKFDAYLLDNWLPGVSGPDLCRQIREFDPYTPVIFYSAAAYVTDKQNAFDAGAQCYLVKPTDPDDLIKVLVSAIAG
jgi:two-component system response regulator TctD